MSTSTASNIRTGLGSRRLHALVAIPVVALAMSAGVFTVAGQTEPAASAAVCNLPTVPNCAT